MKKSRVVALLAIVSLLRCTNAAQEFNLYREHVECSKIRHLGFIMDGNRRWAMKHLVDPWMGHDKGSDVVERVILYCIDKSIEVVSLYMFSLENLKRSESEKSFIFNEILVKKTHQRIDFFRDNNVRVKFIGDRRLFPSCTISTIEWLEDQTKNNTGITVLILFCYGGQQELVDAINRVLKQTKRTEISAKEFEHYLWTADIPHPDLIIRTGGRQRLSNYLVYQSAYSEFYFMDELWPDINEKHLDRALEYYQEVQRNFGA